MTRRHDAPPSPRLQPLYDTEVATPNHGEYARTLAAGTTSATLCTVAREPAGHPYGSFVTYCMEGATPVFLISHLAEHTRNLLRDNRCSLLVAEAGIGDPLARGRVTLVGTCSQLEGEREKSAKAAFLKSHPSAAAYIDYRDFSVWGMAVDSARYIGGFGRMSWLKEEDWGLGEPDPLASSATRIIEHMNEDHEDAMDAMCRAFTKAEKFEGVRMTAVDRYGFEMRLETDEGPRPVRLAFDDQALDTNRARVELVKLTKRARSLLSETAPD